MFYFSPDSPHLSPYNSDEDDSTEENPADVIINDPDFGSTIPLSTYSPDISPKIIGSPHFLDQNHTRNHNRYHKLKIDSTNIDKPDPILEPRRREDALNAPFILPLVPQLQLEATTNDSGPQPACSLTFLREVKGKLNADIPFTGTRGVFGNCYNSSKRKSCSTS